MFTDRQLHNFRRYLQTTPKAEHFSAGAAAALSLKWPSARGAYDSARRTPDMGFRFWKAGAQDQPPPFRGMPEPGGRLYHFDDAPEPEPGSGGVLRIHGRGPAEGWKPGAHNIGREEPSLTAAGDEPMSEGQRNAMRDQEEDFYSDAICEPASSDNMPEYAEYARSCDSLADHLRGRGWGDSRIRKLLKGVAKRTGDARVKAFDKRYRQGMKRRATDRRRQAADAAYYRPPIEDVAARYNRPSNDGPRYDCYGNLFAGGFCAVPPGGVNSPVFAGLKPIRIV